MSQKATIGDKVKTPNGDTGTVENVVRVPYVMPAAEVRVGDRKEKWLLRRLERIV